VGGVRGRGGREGGQVGKWGEGEDSSIHMSTAECSPLH
jgi:hypothetical protein